MIKTMLKLTSLLVLALAAAGRLYIQSLHAHSLGWLKK